MPNVTTAEPFLLDVPKHLGIDAILRHRAAHEPDAIICEVNPEIDLTASTGTTAGALTRAYGKTNTKTNAKAKTSTKISKKKQDTKVRWRKVSVAEFNNEVVAVAKGLVALDIQPGDKVGIMSRTRYEWTLLDFAIWAAGAVPVPIYETSSAEQVEWIVTNADLKAVFVENDDNANTVTKIRHTAPALADLMIIEPRDSRPGAITQLKQMGRAVPDQEINRRRHLATSEDLATIIYTSGTTGRPKGVELTHGNFVNLTLNTVAHVPEVFNGGGRVVLFLPLAHVFARFVQIIAIAGGSVLGHSPDVKNLTRDLGAFRPTYLLGVPRIFEKVYSGAEQSSAADKARGYFHWAARVAIAYSRALDTEAGPSAWLKFQRVFADGLVYSKLRDKLGGKVTFAVSGGGPLGERLGHFYRGLGLNIIEGYGLTESTAPTSVNRPGHTKIGSVGRMVPGTEAKVGDDGEILLKGPHIFRGYHKNPQATAEAFDAQGWFRTGDLGKIDDDGYIHITGRKKEIIVTSGGKNVAPAQLEDRVRSHPLVSQCVVVGDNRPFIGALLTLDAEALPGWLTMHNRPLISVAEAMTDQDILDSLEKAVGRANEAVSKAESIRKWHILPGDFTTANGYLTPSMKVRRAEVLRDFATDVDALYVDTRAGAAPDTAFAGSLAGASTNYIPVA